MFRGILDGLQREDEVIRRHRDAVAPLGPEPEVVREREGIGWTSTWSTSTGSSREIGTTTVRPGENGPGDLLGDRQTRKPPIRIKARRGGFLIHADNGGRVG